MVTCPPSTSASTTTDPQDCYNEVLAFAAPIDYSGSTYAVQPNNHLYKTTNISPTYVARSERLKTLSIDTEDHRKEIIETTGSIAVNLAKVAVGFAAPEAGGRAPLYPPLTLPAVINLSDIEPGVATPLSTDPNVNSGWTITLEYVDQPDGHIERSKFDQGTMGRGLAISTACRSAKLTLQAPSVAITLQFGLTVADPEYLDTVPLPVKGEVDFPELCGPADVKTEQTTQETVNDLSDTLFKQVGDLTSAIKKATPAASPKATATP